MDDLSDLLGAWDEVMCNESESYFDSRLASVLQPPASKAQIAAAEARLGTQLPPSYREFLLISNGALACSGCPVDDPSEGFLPVDQIGWIALLDAELVDLWTDFPELNDAESPMPTPYGTPEEVASFHPLRDGLLISYGTNGPDVLVPVEGHEDWQLWSFHKEGASAHASFADMIRWATVAFAPRPVPSHQVEEMIGALDSQDFAAFPRLGSYKFTTRDPRLAAIAVRLLTEDWIPDQISAIRKMSPETADRFRIIDACGLLHWVPTPQAIEPLRAVHHRTGFSDLRMMTLRTLIKCGDPKIDDLLRSATTDASEQVRMGALRIVAERKAPGMEELLRRALDDPDRLVRSIAIHALVDLGPDDVLDVLNRGLTLSYGRWVVEQLVTRQPERAIELLIEASDDHDLEIRRWAINELLRRDEPAGRQLLRHAATNAEQDKAAQSMRHWAEKRLAQPDLA